MGTPQYSQIGLAQSTQSKSIHICRLFFLADGVCSMSSGEYSPQFGGGLFGPTVNFETISVQKDVEPGA
ncbi:hypothetical protein AYI69_g2612 [Smittium culicis]|uniref:Uncharacterized protein n=1 Tax=Smittium culicis TaxID=133412 RepID=A0A1R1YLY8_9FUNG|nr:hypothetical protein AYI69_g2612 [Smittium culicis]